MDLENTAALGRFDLLTDEECVEKCRNTAGCTGFAVTPIGQWKGLVL